MAQPDHVWVVHAVREGIPVMLSVHTEMDDAVSARVAYTADRRYGGTELDYWVQAVNLGYTRGVKTVHPYNLHIPGWAYCMTTYGTSTKDALARFRKQHNLTRMPKGYAIWRAA